MQTSLLSEKSNKKLTDKFPCPLCGSSDYTKIGGQTVLGNDFNIIECDSCMLIRTSPLLRPEDFSKYYTDDYLPYKAESSLVNLVNRVLFGIETQSFRKYLNQNSNILEIGCSNGNLINYLKTKGYHAIGIEPGDKAAQSARDAGLDVKTTTFEDFQSDTKFDLIIMKSVLEHLADPVRSLKTIATLLKPDGRFFAILPNVDSYERKILKDDWFAWHLPFHCFHYDKKTIKMLAEKAGFEVASVSYSYLPIILAWSIGSRLERKGYKKIAKYFQGHNPIINLMLLPLSIFFFLSKKSSEMSVTLKVRT